MSFRSGEVFMPAVNAGAGCLSLFRVKCLLAAFIAVGCTSFNISVLFHAASCSAIVNMSAHSPPPSPLLNHTVLNQCNTINGIDDAEPCITKKSPLFLATVTTRAAAALTKETCESSTIVLSVLSLC